MPRPLLPLAFFVTALLVAILLTVRAGPDRASEVIVVGVILLFGLAGFLRFGTLSVLVALLAAGYFSGWLKVRYGSWIGYALPDGLCLLLLVGTVLSRGRRGVPLPRTGLMLALLLLTAFCLLQFLNPQSPLIRSVAGFRAWMLYTWLVIAGYEMMQSRRQLLQVYTVILILSMVTAAYGIYQWREGPSALAATGSATLERYAETHAWADEESGRVFRAFSTFVASGVFGMNMAVGLLIVVVLIGARDVPGRIRLLALGGAPLLAAGIAASGARGPLVVLALGTAMLFVLRRGRATVPTLLLMGVAAWLAVLLTSSVVTSRFATLLDLEYLYRKWAGPLGVGLDIAAQNPLGKGLGYTAGLPSLVGGAQFSGVEHLNIDSGIGAAAAELGFVGLAVYLFLLLQMVSSPLRSWRATRDERLKELLLVPVVLSTIFAITAVLAPMSASLPYSIYLWVLVGMTLKAPNLAPETVTEEPAESPEAGLDRPPLGRPVYGNLG